MIYAKQLVAIFFYLLSQASISISIGCDNKATKCDVCANELSLALLYCMIEQQGGGNEANAM